MKHVFIIAEAGVNHNGSLKTAKELVDKAKNCGVDAVKFQTFRADNLVSKKAKKAAYQKKSTDLNETQFEMIKKLELSFDHHVELIKYCKKKDIQFLSSPFDLGSIDLLYGLGLDLFKIPSGEIINLPFLVKIGKLNKKIILSTGMADLGEIEDALNVLIEQGTKKRNITVLHCNSEYPTPFEDVNLNAMLTIKNAFNISVGYSDHTKGIEVPIAAVALGAEVIEKHFTLDKNMEGPDHRASIEPDELNLMVDAIRNIEKALGTGIKKPSPSEIKNIKIVRKSIHSNCDIRKGDLIDYTKITMKRPGDGISPMFVNSIIGKMAKKDILKDTKLKLTDIE